MGVTWIEASAGTGKTYTIVETVVALIRDRAMTASSILLVTFTEKATAELKTRIRQGIRDAWKKTSDPLLAQALEDLPSLTITTIHGFCRTLLGQYPLESGVSFEPDMVDQGQRWRRLLRDQLRPRLLELDAGLLAWAGLEEEEAFLQLAKDALDRGLFGLPRVQPESSGITRFQELRGQLEQERGGLWEAVDQLRGINLKAEPYVELLHARNHKNPFRVLGLLSRVQTPFDLLPLLEKKEFEYFRTWDEDGSMWKKAAQPPFDGELERARLGALAFVAGVEALESSLPTGVGLGSFLRLSARFCLLESLCLPVLERRSSKELTFHDLIDRVHSLVTHEQGGALIAGARARWHCALVDEFQDTDALQWEIFAALFLTPTHDLYLVGDPKQSIYRFRGADLAVYRRVRDQVLAKGAISKTLEENYRSTEAMIRAVNSVFDPASGAAWENPSDFLASKKGNKPVAALLRSNVDGRVEEVAPMLWKRAESQREWHRFLVKTVADFLDGNSFLDDGQSPRRPLTSGDFLVLVRKKREAWTLYHQFTEQGIAATVGGSGGLLRTREAREVLLFLQALESPRSQSAARALGWTRLFARASAEQLSPALDAASGDRDRGAYLLAFRRVHSALEAGVCDGGGLESLLAAPGGARIVTNVEQILELVQDRHHRGEVVAGKAALALETWIASKRQEDEVDLRRDTEAPTLRLMTVHAAKGLEAPIVLHGWSSPGKPKEPAWFVTSKGVDFLLTAAGREEEAIQLRSEELRLRYVAMTRAQCHQVLPTEDPNAASVPRLSVSDWKALRAQGSEVQPLLPELKGPLAGLEARHPWVESHSGLLRRAMRGEEGQKAVWDRAGIQRDEGVSVEAVEGLGESLPAGPDFGDLVHDVLEAVDFRAWAALADPAEVKLARTVVEDLCLRRRALFRGQDLSGPLFSWLAQLLNHPLALGPDSEPVVFSNLAPAKTRRELEFHLPLALAPGGDRSFEWSKRLFVVHPGFLTGRIDLLFVHQERLYLVDWKTNRLLPGQEPDDLMVLDGYDLQAQWYWEALRRLCRIQGELLSPGGVLYVFLRGGWDQPKGIFLSPAHLDSIKTLSPFLKEDLHGQ